MSTITSINTSSASSVSQTRHRPDASTMASALLKKLDTDSTGTISQAELETTLKDASGSDASSSSAASLMKGLDSDSDGSISKQELTDGLQKLSDQFDAQFNASRTSHVGGPPPGGGCGGPPPADGASGTSDSSSSSISSAASSSSSSSAGSYDAADINQDGSVSAEERQTYQQKQAEKNGGTDAVSGQDRGLSHILKQLAEMYGSSAANTQNTSAISVTA
jgi:hypothetical protein